MPDARMDAALLRRLNVNMLQHNDKSIFVSELQGDGAKNKGVGTITFQANAPCIRLRLPGKPVKWLATQRCGDAIVIELASERTIVHLIELKSKITAGEWTKTKEQLAGAYHNALAVAGVLQLAPPFDIKVHVAYREDCLSPDTSPELQVLKQPLGTPATETFNDWSEGRIGIDDRTDIPLYKILRDNDGNASAELG